EQVSESEFEGEPVIRDRRRIDPATGRLREQEPESSGGDAQTHGVPTGAGPDDGEDESREEAPDPLVEAKTEAADLFDQLQRSRADLYNLDQRFNNYVRRSRAEVEAGKLEGVNDVVEELIP